MTASVHVGCQGWAYDDWITGPADEPVFYPTGTRNEQMLELYARAFTTVEIDSTLYAVPSAPSVENWNKRTPECFKFSLKLQREITHDRMFGGDSLTLLEQFCVKARLLGDKLACILIQTPSSFEPTTENFASWSHFISNLPADIRFAMEFRNRDWLESQAVELLKKSGVALSLVQGKWLRDSDIRWMAANPTADFAYVRWMGARDLTKFDIVQRPQDENLKRWTTLINYLKPEFKTIYGYFSNFYEGNAVVSANKLKGMLNQPVHDPAELGGQQSLFA